MLNPINDPIFLSIPEKKTVKYTKTDQFLQIAVNFFSEKSFQRSIV